tara:strand:- start:318 stop:488 length:171 start_codon:yes stop_codon:yes gene_type:complete
MLGYLLIGVTFTWFVDVTSYKNGVKFNAPLRVACVLAWPLGMLSFLWGYYKGRNND